MQLLTNEFQNMAKLADKYIAARTNMTYISPDALQNDDLNQRIVGCGHSLGVHGREWSVCGRWFVQLKLEIPGAIPHLCLAERSGLLLLTITWLHC